MRDRWVSEMLNAGSRTMTYRAVQRYQAARRGADKRLRRRLEDLEMEQKQTLTPLPLIKPL